MTKLFGVTRNGLMIFMSIDEVMVDKVASKFRQMYPTDKVLSGEVDLREPHSDTNLPRLYAHKAEEQTA